MASQQTDDDICIVETDLDAMIQCRLEQNQAEAEIDTARQARSRLPTPIYKGWQNGGYVIEYDDGSIIPANMLTSGTIPLDSMVAPINADGIAAINEIPHTPTTEETAEEVEITSYACYIFHTRNGGNFDYYFGGLTAEPIYLCSLPRFGESGTFGSSFSYAETISQPTNIQNQIRNDFFQSYQQIKTQSSGSIQATISTRILESNAGLDRIWNQGSAAQILVPSASGGAADASGGAGVGIDSVANNSLTWDYVGDTDSSSGGDSYTFPDFPGDPDFTYYGATGTMGGFSGNPNNYSTILLYTISQNNSSVESQISLNASFSGTWQEINYTDAWLSPTADTVYIGIRHRLGISRTFENVKLFSYQINGGILTDLVDEPSANDWQAYRAAGQLQIQPHPCYPSTNLVFNTQFINVVANNYRIEFSGLNSQGQIQTPSYVSLMAGQEPFSQWFFARNIFNQTGACVFGPPIYFLVNDIQPTGSGVPFATNTDYRLLCFTAYANQEQFEQPA